MSDEPLHSPLNQIADCNTPRFVYQPLDSSRSEIRLLELAPGVRDAELHCNLVHALLKDKPSYEALSYTWGDARNRRSILMYGYTFSITVNLEIALRHLRRPNEMRKLWVDALCINQENPEERTQQVQKMRDIFWSAQHVLAWTGEPSEESGEALELLQGLSQPSTFLYIFEVAAEPTAFSTINFNPGWRKWELLFRFLNRPYWSRVWVVQELAVPGSGVCDLGGLDNDKVQISCGSAWIPISTFNVACATLGQLIPGMLSSVAFLTLADPSSRRHPAGLDMFGTVQSCIPTARGQRLSIRELLPMTHFLKATDPRDRVYALIALARDEDRVLVPDYSVSIAQILRELVRHLVLTDDNLMVLSGNRLPPSKTVDGSSSWAPDPERVIYSPRIDWQPETTPFKVSNSRAPAVTFSNDLRFLTAKGIIVDKIDTVIGPFDWKKSPGLSSEKLSATELMRFLQELEKYGSSLSAIERDIFWRTLVLDSGELGHGQWISPAPTKIGDWFEVLLKSPSAPDDSVGVEATKLFYQQVGFVDRCFYATASGKKGVGPYGTLQGDLVTILYGGQFCYVLRKVGEHYIFVGDAYLHGVMHGELLDPGREEWKHYEESGFVLR